MAHSRHGPPNAADAEPANPDSDFLKAQRDAVIDAAGISAGLWLSYLFVLFYLAVAAGSVTHRDLLLETPVKLPFLGVELPIVAFFTLAPLLLLIVHTYVLLHFVQFADKLGDFSKRLEGLPKEDEQAQRRRLPSNIFAQLLAGPTEIQTGIKGFLLWLTAHISLVFAPLATLILFELTFLPYHSATTWWHRIAILIDIVVLWILWPSVARGKAALITWDSIVQSAKSAASAGTRLAQLPFKSGRREALRLTWSDLKESTIAALIVASAVLAFQVVTVATYPGERIHSWPSLHFIPWWNAGPGFPVRLASPYELLFAEGVNLAERKPTGLFSNRIVLPGLKVIDPAKYDSEAKVAALTETISLRARHLEGAVLIDAALPNADFTAAVLTGALFDRADLRGAKFDCAATENNPDIWTAGRYCAQIANASFVRASLQGVSMVGAHLQNAQFSRAKMQGAKLDRAHMQGANLDNAVLLSASLNEAQLQGAVLSSAWLQGASLSGTQLQGAKLDDAQLQNATLLSVFAWRSDIRSADTTGARIINPITAPKEACGPERDCDWSAASFAQLKELVSPPGRIDLLDPTRPLKNEHDMATAWAALAGTAPALDTFERGLMARLRETGCVAEGAPYVLRGMIQIVPSMFAVSPTNLAELAKAFLDIECAGNYGLPDADKAKLTEMKLQQIGPGGR